MIEKYYIILSRQVPFKGRKGKIEPEDAFVNYNDDYTDSLLYAEKYRTKQQAEKGLQEILKKHRLCQVSLFHSDKSIYEIKELIMEVKE